MSKKKESDLIKDIVFYLNYKADKKFKHTSSITKRLISARLRDRYTYEDFKMVIELKVSQWKDHEQMDNYLRPSTLFAPTNFENYLNEALSLAKRNKIKDNKANGWEQWQGQ